MDLNLLPNRGLAEDLPSSSLSTDRSIAILYQMTEEDDGIPTRWLTSFVPRESGIVDRDLQGNRNFDSIKNETKKGRVWKQWFQSFSCSVCLGVLQDQKPTTDEQDKLTQLSLGNFARNTSQPLPRLPDHEETYNHEVLQSPPCKRAELSSSEGKGRTYKKFSFEEMEKLIEGVEKYRGKYCNWKTIKKLYFEDSNRSKDQLKGKVETYEEICKQANRSPSKEALCAGIESPNESSKFQIIQVQGGGAPKFQFRKSINIYL
ncbi:unnamed protein product [Camellia sinensis]